MDAPELPENVQHDERRGIAGRGGRKTAIPPGISLTIALVVILTYWGTGLFCGSLGIHLPWWVWLLLYFAHYSAWGGLIGFLVSIWKKNWKHCEFWGAVIGVVMSAILMA